MDNVLSKINKDHKVTKFITFLLGCLIASLAYNIVFVPNNIIVGGVTGLAIIFKKITGLSTTIFVDIADLVLLLIGFIFLGKKGVVGHAFGSIFLPIMVTLTAPLSKLITVDIGSKFLTIIIAGVFYGFACGLLFRAGYSAGGSDVLIDIVSKKLHKPVTKLGVYINGFVILLGAFFFDPENIMYALLVLVIINKVANIVLFGESTTKMVYVISKKNKDIEEYVMNEIHTGATEINIKDGLFKAKKQMLLCVVHNKDYKEFKNNILKMDPRAFILSNNCYEASGGVVFSLIPF